MRDVLVAVTLVCGISVGTAAEANTTAAKITIDQGMASSASLWRLQNEISLPGNQKRTTWEDIRQQAKKEEAPPGFNAKVGAPVPNTIAIHPIPVSAANDVPKLWPYSYALLDRNELLIINPSTNKIVEVVRE
jgi:hypothetical protein